MADSCVGSTTRCGGDYPMWLSGGHPTVRDGVVRRRICTYHSNNACCATSSQNSNLASYEYLKVKMCPGGFYVYQFPGWLQMVRYRTYCTVKDTSNPCLDSNCTHGCVNNNGKARCTCPGNTQECLNPCRVNNGNCSHTCKPNSAGSVYCSCPPNTELGEDQKTCVDPCSKYRILSERWRNTNYGYNVFCDDFVQWDSWYRVTGAAGNKLSDTCPSYQTCGTGRPMWLQGGHPTQKDGIVTRKICTRTSSSSSYCCDSRDWRLTVNFAKVRKCPGGYFVYKMPKLAYYCNRAYCGVRDTSDPCLDSNCTHGCTNRNGKAQCTCPSTHSLAADKQSCESPCDTNNGGCSYRCTLRQDGNVVCSCPSGLMLASDKKTCDTPCVADNAGCSHFCHNGKDGVATCHCPPDLVLGNDKKTCITTCRLNNGGCSHLCKDSSSGAVCSCPKTGCTDVNMRCACEVRLEANGTSNGPVLLDLPTLIYGHKQLWATEGKDEDAFIVTDKFPTFHQMSVKKKKALTSLSQMQMCLKVLRNCPNDCEKLAKLYFGPTGPYKTIDVAKPDGKLLTKALGQLMCERYQLNISPPGKRAVVYYDPGTDCGTSASTHAFDFKLCCKATDLSDLGRVTFWNPKCASKMKLPEPLVG